MCLSSIPQCRRKIRGQGSSLEEMAVANKRITQDWGARFRAITPGSGGYGNEGDVMEPNFGQAFFGTNYARLVRIKKAVDPWGVSSGLQRQLAVRTGISRARRTG
jgi:hypothetical protein